VFILPLVDDPGTQARLIAETGGWTEAAAFALALVGAGIVLLTVAYRGGR
jgi:hypothetical protein